MGCCGSRNREIRFELVYLIYPIRPEERRKSFSVFLGESFTEASILASLCEKVSSLSIPDVIKNRVRQHEFLLNGVHLSESRQKRLSMSSLSNQGY